MPDLHVDLADAFDWLQEREGEGAVVAMLPDAAELGMHADDLYRGWFRRAAKACIRASTGPTVFVQTDRKHDRRWIDKAALLIECADSFDLSPLWHRIALRRDVGLIDIHRPTYSHMIAFAPGKPGSPAPDVINGGPRSWPNGVGVSAAAHVAQYLATQKVKLMVNPFCGVGTFMQAARRHGIDAIGCDTDADRVAAAMQAGSGG